MVDVVSHKFMLVKQKFNVVIHKFNVVGHKFNVVQLRTIKVIKLDNLRTRIFIGILTSDSEPETSKTSRNGVALIFPCFFGCAKFLGVFNAPKSLPNQPSLDQFCAMHDPYVVDV